MTATANPGGQPETQHPTRRQTQRRTVATLSVAQTLGGLGLAAAAAVSPLIAEGITGKQSLAGLGGTAQWFGTAMLAIPMAAIMARMGRRPGLIFGYLVGVTGAVGLVVAATLRDFTLFLLASALYGGGVAANGQGRFAAADLAEDAHRGRDLSLIVWATTIGSVIGPHLVTPGAFLASLVGAPQLAGSYLFAFLAYASAALVIFVMLRPDPLLEAQRLSAVDAETGTIPDSTAGPASSDEGTMWTGLRALGRHPKALLGVAVMSLGTAVMIGVMVMTPVHMNHGGAHLRVIGLVISLHILGMFAFSPLVGAAVDRFGAPRVALVGAAQLFAAGTIASQTAPGSSIWLTVALFLLGLGWSCTMISGSTLLAAYVAVNERAGAQGAGDLVMGLSGAAAGGMSGLIVQAAGFSTLGLIAAGLAALIAVAVAVTGSLRHSGSA